MGFCRTTVTVTHHHGSGGLGIALGIFALSTLTSFIVLIAVPLVTALVYVAGILCLVTCAILLILAIVQAVLWIRERPIAAEFTKQTDQALDAQQTKLRAGMIYATATRLEGDQCQPDTVPQPLPQRHGKQ